MKHFPPNKFRGLIGLFSLIAVVAGAWILWGFGAALFSGGLSILIDASSDEAVERFTNTSRYPHFPQETAHD